MEDRIVQRKQGKNAEGDIKEGGAHGKREKPRKQDYE